ncbi:TPA: hypothetical protein ACX3GK_000582 [Vibrio parahaemolyticus]|nr:hypothetical protein [Vibrio parahaemolyticus]
MKIDNKTLNNNKIKEGLKYKKRTHGIAITLNLLLCTPAFMYMWMVIAPRLQSRVWDGVADELILLGCSGFIAILTLVGTTYYSLYCWQNYKGSSSKLLQKFEYKALLFYSFSWIAGFAFLGIIIKETVGPHKIQTVEIQNDHIIFNHGKVHHITPLSLEWKLFWHGKVSLLSKAAVTGPGGSTNAAYYMKYKLQKLGIQETIAYGDRCDSACTILWTVGEKHSFQDPIYLGFHQTCGDDKEKCKTLAHLYDGFLTRDLIEIIASPNGYHACPLGVHETTTLEGVNSIERQQLLEKIIHLCKDKGLSEEEFADFRGYEYISISG